ncbi:SAM-dependent methyltransferase [Mesorhizobium sp. DCY119]|uniref:SAM-dependent methyltransferase n=1 Tax=Mesorhizobium sp. DCY119 TaxID=2108445 RepID=UPI000E6D53B3|nr:SAM-dependent methyltransferase [Mesorhizobium sp. DCY119]RJG43082.1 siroheme synthase [Mesorhizobium sp. DCY119]
MHGVFKRQNERAPARMGRLSVLPVFFSLEDKRVLVAGGSEAALWKAELLAAAGAQVHVFAPASELCADFVPLIENGSFVHHDEGWSAEVLEDMAIAVADAACEDEAKAFHAAAIAAGVPVNVIDKPEFCQFQFGSIVNRSPVVIGISTAGAAPILAQAIRRRIETLLPASLSAWAHWAQTMRASINARLVAGTPRRDFWERFVRRAFDRPFTQREASGLFREANSIAANPDQMVGRITLVGAGPGEAELLTIKAVRVLQAADIILFDDVVTGEALELARREAQRIRVEGSERQSICEQMIALARSGKHVVWLIAGDPTHDRHADAAIDRVESEGIQVDLVPGVVIDMAAKLAFNAASAERIRPECMRSVA